MTRMNKEKGRKVSFQVKRTNVSDDLTIIFRSFVLFAGFELKKLSIIRECLFEKIFDSDSVTTLNFSV